MRTYGRVTNEWGVQTWVEVDTDPAGHNDYVWITTLCQCLKLVLGESPFWSNYGIAAQQSLITQVFPDFDVARTQQQFAQYFASLQVYKQPPTATAPDPVYNLNIITNQGVKVAVSIPV